MATRWTIVTASIVGLLCSACHGDAAAPEAEAAERPSFRASPFTENTTFVIDQFFFVPCANGGLGEDVRLTGVIHDLFHLTDNGQGGFNVKVHDNPQGVIGVGQTTGTKYQGTGVTQSIFSVGVGQRETDVNNFRLIAQGQAPNYLAHDNFHFTINANGVVTSGHDNFSIECK